MRMNKPTIKKKMSKKRNLTSLALDEATEVMKYVPLSGLCRLWCSGSLQMQILLERSVKDTFLDLAWQTTNPIFPIAFLARFRLLRRFSLLNEHLPVQTPALDLLDICRLPRSLEIIDLNFPRANFDDFVDFALHWPNLRILKIKMLGNISLQNLTFPAHLTILKLDWQDLDISTVLSALPPSLTELRLVSDQPIAQRPVNWPPNLTYLLLDTMAIDLQFMQGLPDSLLDFHFLIWFNRDHSIPVGLPYAVFGGEESTFDGFVYYDIWYLIPSSVTNLSVSIGSEAGLYATTTDLDPSNLPRGLKNVMFDLDSFDASMIPDLWAALPEIETISSDSDVLHLKPEWMRRLPNKIKSIQCCREMPLSYLENLPTSIKSLLGCPAEALSCSSLALPPHLTELSISHHSTTSDLKILRITLPDTITALNLVGYTIDPTQPDWKLPKYLTSFYCCFDFFNSCTQQKHCLKVLPMGLRELTIRQGTNDDKFLEFQESALFLPPIVTNLNISVQCFKIYDWISYIPQSVPLKYLTVNCDVPTLMRLVTWSDIPEHLPYTIKVLALSGHFHPEQFDRIPKGVIQLYLYCADSKLWSPDQLELLPRKPINLM